MKLTNKILSVFAFLVLIITTTVVIVIVLNIEIAVTPSIDGQIKKEFPNDSFSEIEITRGMIVRITQSDSFSIRIEGGDNFINNYLFVKQIGEKLILKIRPGIKHHSLKAIVDIKMPTIKKLEIQESEFDYYTFSTSYSLSNFVLENLNVILSEDGSISMKKSSIDTLSLKCAEFSSAAFDSCKIGSVNYSLEDYSYARLSDVYESIDGELDQKAIISFSRPKSEPTIINSMSFDTLSNSINESMTDLKWGSAVDKSIQVVKNVFGSRISESFLFKKYRYLNLYPLLSYVKFEEGEYLGCKIEDVNLFFYRNALQSITIYFDNTSFLEGKNFNILTQEIRNYYPHIQISKKGRMALANLKNLYAENSVQDISILDVNNTPLFYIASRELVNAMQNEFKLKSKKYGTLENEERQTFNKYYKSLENLIYYGLKE